MISPKVAKIFESLIEIIGESDQALSGQDLKKEYETKCNSGKNCVSIKSTLNKLEAEIIMSANPIYVNQNGNKEKIRMTTIFHIINNPYLGGKFNLDKPPFLIDSNTGLTRRYRMNYDTALYFSREEQIHIWIKKAYRMLQAKDL